MQANLSLTKGGSFWTNHSVDLLYLSPIEDPRTNPRNNCIHSGYMSVALVPIHSGDEIIGLLQLNDRQPGRFTPDLIQFFEKIGSAIGVAFKRMQYEEKIKESEDKYRRIVETANEGILWVDEKRVITFSNSKMMQILGCQINELIGRKFESLLFPEDIADHSRKLEARRKGKPEIYELRFRHHDGRIVWTLVSAVPILDAQGEFKGSFAMFTDITGRKQAEEILIEKEERYQSLIQTSLDGFWVADSEGRLLEVNDAYCLMTGYSREKLLTMRISDLECAESQEKTHEHIQKIISTGHDRFESKHRCADGEIINVQINTIYINSKSIFLVFINDITKRKLAEKELIEAKEKAEESDRLKSAFLATMSHELRTPLNAVIGFSGLIDEEMPMDQITSFAQVIHKSGNNLLEIVEGIFDLTMLESKEVKVKAGHFNLSSFIIDLLELAKYEQKKSGKQQVDIKYISGSGNGHADLYSDKGKLTKVMIQLLKNALKFTPSGKIEFGYVLEPEGKYDQIKFFVKDTGIGIPENQKSIIFERFRQIDDSLARNFGGTGIGLSISKQTVELLGGQIGVDSEPGKGSTFYFTIPILKQEQLPNTVRVSKQEDNGGKRETFSNQTVLIAEDEDSNYMYLRILLLRLNLQVLHAHDGLEAVNLCSVHPEISLVLMDINMPNMNGLEATKEIKLTNAKLPVIAVTAFTMPGDREKFMAGGCDEYLEKPIKQDKLLTLLRSFIN